jgi:hypothetical protein
MVRSDKDDDNSHSEEGGNKDNDRAGVNICLNRDMSKYLQYV